jgi:SAM-dependent methyltransferase
MVEAAEIREPAEVVTITADAGRLPFAAGAFDVVIASEVLEHLVDDRGAIREVVRVLRPGGRLALSVPRYGPERINWTLSARYHNVEGGHLRIYRRSRLIGLLESEGLQLVDTHHSHGLHSPYWWLKCVVGVDNGDNPLVRAFHRLLVYDIVRHPKWLAVTERMLNPLIGKSFVCYLVRQ